VLADLVQQMASLWAHLLALESRPSATTTTMSPVFPTASRRTSRHYASGREKAWVTSRHAPCSTVAFRNRLPRGCLCCHYCDLTTFVTFSVMCMLTRDGNKDIPGGEWHPVPVPDFPHFPRSPALILVSGKTFSCSHPRLTFWGLDRSDFPKAKHAHLKYRIDGKRAVGEKDEGAAKLKTRI
jgi:hypothetical protein